MNKKNEKLEKDPSGILNEEQYAYFKIWINKHKHYKKLYIPVIIIGCLQCFILPFFIGFCYSLIDNINTFYEVGIGFNLMDLLLAGFGFLCLQAPLFDFTLPISFFFGCFIMPIILKLIIFSKKYPYNDDLMKELGLGVDAEITAGSAGLGSVVITNFSKNKNASNNKF